MSSSSESKPIGKVLRARRSRTAGGARLRALREASGRTQLWVEIEAELGAGYLQRIESGKVAQPERSTLERILATLGARYSEQREVMETFGYTMPAPPPTDDDVAWACAVAHRELHEVPFPAYVLDCTHRLLAWNRCVPPLFGISPRDPTLGGLAGLSLLAPWFDPASPLAPLVAEPGVFLPALIRALRYEMQQFHAEPWYATLLARLMELPRFRHYWSVVEQEPPPAGAARALVPARLFTRGMDMTGSPHTEVLEFRLASERFTRDARFRMLYYFPANAETMRHCATWTVPPDVHTEAN